MFKAFELRQDLHKVRAAVGDDPELHHIINKWLNRVERMIEAMQPLEKVMPSEFEGLKIWTEPQGPGQAVAQFLGRYAALEIEIAYEKAHAEIAKGRVISVSSSEGVATKVVGFLFGLDIRGEVEDLGALWEQAKTAAANEIKAYPFTLRMPCGETRLFPSAQDVIYLPIVDVPCPCGDPTHWLIKFERHERQS